MKRFLITARCDITLQFRNGFYYASAFFIVFWLILYTQVPGIRQLDMAWLMPGFLLGNIVVYAFYYIAGLVLLEKGEGTIEAQVVTPLRIGEYLGAKVLTLTLLSLIEGLLLALIYHGPGFNGLYLVVGVGFAAALFTLAGFIVIARYDSVNEFLFPSVMYTMLLALPLFDYFAIIQSPLFYLHPLQGPLTVLKAAFNPVPVWQLVYGLLYSSVWVYLAYRISYRAFINFLVRKEGVR